MKFNISKQTYSIIKVCLIIPIIAIVLGTIFNSFISQGIGLLPPEIKTPNLRLASLEKIRQLYLQGALFIDTRDSNSYARSRIRNAVKLPVNEINQIYPLLKPKLDKSTILVTYGRNRSSFPAATVAYFLNNQGYNVWVSEGNLDSLKLIGLPIKENKRTIHQ